jgi:predicted anti-sigma-YlaC factor YlaD
MFSRTNALFGCPEYQASLEDALRDGEVCIEPKSALELHLQACADCREALNDALTTSKLMGHARYPEYAASPAFVTRVMATIREATEAAPNAIWRPLELLASRMALVAAVVLLALSVYLREFAPARGSVAVNAQTEIGAGMPEPPATPADADEVLMSLADTGDAI